MGNLGGIKGLVQFAQAAIEAKRVFGATIEINLRLQIRGGMKVRR